MSWHCSREVWTARSGELVSFSSETLGIPTLLRSSLFMISSVKLHMTREWQAKSQAALEVRSGPWGFGSWCLVVFVIVWRACFLPTLLLHLMLPGRIQEEFHSFMEGDLKEGPLLCLLLCFSPVQCLGNHCGSCLQSYLVPSWCSCFLADTSHSGIRPGAPD